MFRALLCGVIAVTLPSDAYTQTYQRPPKAVTDILDVPPPPALSVSPTSDALLLIHGTRYPSIEEVAAKFRANVETVLPEDVAARCVETLTRGETSHSSILRAVADHLT